MCDRDERVVRCDAVSSIVRVLFPAILHAHMYTHSIERT